MRNQTYTTRRDNLTATSYGRNRNIVRHGGQGLGVISQTVIVSLLVLVVGLIYVTQGSQATSYDYQLSEIENEIAELESKKEDLAVQQARATAIATTQNSRVAAAMENATASGYASE